MSRRGDGRQGFLEVSVPRTSEVPGTDKVLPHNFVTLALPHYDVLLMYAERRPTARTVQSGAFDYLNYVLTGIEGKRGLAHEVLGNSSGEDAECTVRRIRKSESRFGMLLVTTRPSLRLNPEVHNLVLRVQGICARASVQPIPLTQKGLFNRSGELRAPPKDGQEENEACGEGDERSRDSSLRTLGGNGPDRIRTYDQGIHSAPVFPPGVDYLFTRAPGEPPREISLAMTGEHASGCQTRNFAGARQVRVGAGRSSLLSRALEPSGSLCTFRRCTGGSAQGCHGATAEGFPEFIPSTSRVSARRHLIDESPALTAVLQAQRAAIVAALSRSEAKQRAARVAVGTTVPGERNLADAAVTGSAGVHRALVPRRCVAFMRHAGWM